MYAKNCEDGKIDFQANRLSSSQFTPEIFLELLKHTSFSNPKAKLLHRVNKNFFQGTNPDICTFVAREALESSNFAIAQTFSLLSPDIDLCTELLEKWSTEGSSDEKPWFVARFVLYKIASDRTSDARAIFTYFASQDTFQNARPLHQYLKYVFRCIDLKSGDLFKIIDEKFQPYLQRDNEFQQIADRIGQLHFDIVKPRQPTMMDMMSRMMGI